ncbi:MAG: M23 family metallopeptidase [Clostridia bacterium]|nr:M23 family metallopeptidase [Clostridia bacterium]
MKNKALTVVLLLLLLIPTYIGVYSYIHTNRTPVTPQSATGILLSDPSGKSYDIPAKSDFAKLLTSINETSTPLASLPEALNGADYYKAVFTAGKQETEYRYYFSQNTSTAYFLTQSGTPYLISEDNARAFLACEYAQSLYPEAYMPRLQNGDNLILASDYTWAYARDAEGKDVAASTLADTAENATYVSHAGLSLLFDRAPQNFDVTIKTPDGETLYTGAYDALRDEVDIHKHETLVIDAAADWVGNSEHLSSGKATYHFTLKIEARTAFTLSTDTVLPGSLLTVLASGISDPAKIGFSAAPALVHEGREITPRFYADGSACYALLPTTYETAPGQYQLNFTYDGVTYPLTLTVTEKTFKNQAYDVSKSVADAKRNAKTLAAFESIQKEICGGDFSTRYFDGLFTTGILEDGYTGTVMTGYGLHRRVTAQDDEYRNPGVDYYAKDGSTVIAMNAGRVIYSGVSDYPGVFVVIDHGYGLLSWYCNLQKATVNVGDVVAAGDAIAVSGSTGFTKGNAVHTALTVFDIPVCPYDLWETPIYFK